MKVCTDACLFGAWVAKKLQENKIKADDILDIGCGTGLLSLMIAQKSTGQIDAVEIDEGAFEQAKENTHLSKWRKRINIYHSSIKDYQSSKKYDVIITNPPFYENQLKSQNEGRNKAMHATTLSYIELSVAIKKHLNETGYAAVLLPYSLVEKLEEALLTQQLFIIEKLNVSHTNNDKYIRIILLISSIENKLRENYFSIKSTDQEYSTEFKDLLKDYYLNF